MSVMTDTYIEELANGFVPREGSVESDAWKKESVWDRDYTWALTEWARIREAVQGTDLTNLR
jgi:hypothetical protein